MRSFILVFTVNTDQELSHDRLQFREKRVYQEYIEDRDMVTDLPDCTEILKRN
jgi:hypothetical protein